MGRESAIWVIALLLFVCGCISPYFCDASNYTRAVAKKRGVSYRGGTDVWGNSLDAELDSSKEAKQYYGKSWEFFKEGKYAEALEQLEKAEKITPGSWKVVLYKGKAYLNLDRPDEAIEYLNRSLDGPPENYRVIYNLLGSAYRIKQDYSQAIEYYKKVLSYSSVATDYYLLAHTYVIAGNYGEAILNYTKAIESNNDEAMRNAFGRFAVPILYEQRGYCYYKKGMAKEAKDDVKRILSYYPRYEKAFGSEQEMLNYFDFDKRKTIANEAIKAAKQAEDSGNYLEAFLQLEKAYSVMPAFDLASHANLDKEIIDGYFRVYPKLSLKPAMSESVRRLFVQADAYVKNKDALRALTAYDSLLILAPWLPEAWFNLAYLQADQKEYKEAIENMKKYLQLDPNSPDARLAQDKIYEWETLIIPTITIY